MEEKRSDKTSNNIDLAINARASLNIVRINEPEIHNLIYTVRGHQVILDNDLAVLFQVETKNLNRAAKRNESRFPEDFRFQLNAEEFESLRCQFVTPNEDQQGTRRGGRRYLPYAYTERGVATLSAVLHSEVAIEASVRVIRAFVEMRRFIVNNAAMFEQIRAVELKQLEYQKTTDKRFERVFDYMDKHTTPKQKVFFDGEIYDAFDFLVGLIRQAESKIVLIDGYVDVDTLNILAKKAPGVSVAIWTHPKAALSQRDVDAFNAQYPTLEMKRTVRFHDRFLIIDDTKGYLIGASLKDAGKKSFAISCIEDEDMTHSILDRLTVLSPSV